jgi:hypothetical protein
MPTSVYLNSILSQEREKFPIYVSFGNDFLVLHLSLLHENESFTLSRTYDYDRPAGMRCSGDGAPV